MVASVLVPAVPAAMTATLQRLQDEPSANDKIA
jgi:hypothetical protein